MLASRLIASNRAHFLLAVIAVALAITAMIVCESVVAGISQLIPAYLEHAPGSLVLVGHDTRSFLLGPEATLSADVSRRAHHVQGVAAVSPVLAMYTTLEVNGEKRAAYLVGYEPELGGGPWRLAVGREPAGDKEVVVDSDLAARARLTLGSTLRVADEDLHVCGLSQGTALGLQHFIFTRRRAAERLLDRPGQATYLFVTVQQVADTGQVQTQLAGLPGARVLVKANMEANDLRTYSPLLILPFRAVSLLAFLLGSLVIALLGYGSILERRREYAVLKALGAPERTLYLTVLLQAAAISLAGLAVGAALGVGVVCLVAAVAPLDPIALVPGALARPALAAASMVYLGALIPARLVARLAPAGAFRR